MQNAGLDESQTGIKIAGRNISNLRYTGYTTWMAESEEKLKSLLMTVWESLSLLGKQMGKMWKQCQISFSWAPKSMQTVTAVTKLNDASSLEE